MPAESPLTIVYFGSGAFGLPTLKRLVDENLVRAIVTQPDRPAGRGGTLTPTPIAQWAAAHGGNIPVLKPERVNEPDVVAQVRATGAGVFVVIAFGQKLGRPLLDGVFAINLHASLLPRWRGAAPINAAILAGDRESGNSVITLADRMDAGLVLGQSGLPIGPDMTAGELHDLLAENGPALVDHVLDAHRRGTLAPVPQDESLVTVAPKLSKADGWVDFTAPARDCARRINGLSPWPGITVRFRGEPLKLLRASTELSDLPAPAAGYVQIHAGAGAGPSPAGSVLPGGEGVIACGHRTCLRLLEVQPAGKRAMSWRDFSNGRQVKSEEVLQGGKSPC